MSSRDRSQTEIVDYPLTPDFEEPLRLRRTKVEATSVIADTRVQVLDAHLEHVFITVNLVHLDARLKKTDFLYYPNRGRIVGGDRCEDNLRAILARQVNEAMSGFGGVAVVPVLRKDRVPNLCSPDNFRRPVETAVSDNSVILLANDCADTPVLTRRCEVDVP